MSPFEHTVWLLGLGGWLGWHLRGWWDQRGKPGPTREERLGAAVIEGIADVEKMLVYTGDEGIAVSETQQWRLGDRSYRLTIERAPEQAEA